MYIGKDGGVLSNSDATTWDEQIPLGRELLVSTIIFSSFGCFMRWMFLNRYQYHGIKIRDGE